MSRDEYFTAVRGWPWAFLDSFTLGIPPQWISEAWDLPEVQNNLVAHGFVQDVSKTGSLCHSQYHLHQLAECLSSDQVRRFYLDIRNASRCVKWSFGPDS